MTNRDSFVGVFAADWKHLQGGDGEQVGVVLLEAAMAATAEASLDLVRFIV